MGVSQKKGVPSWGVLGDTHIHFWVPGVMSYIGLYCGIGPTNGESNGKEPGK